MKQITFVLCFVRRPHLSKLVAKSNYALIIFPNAAATFLSFIFLILFFFFGSLLQRPNAASKNPSRLTAANERGGFIPALPGHMLPTYTDPPNPLTPHHPTPSPPSRLPHTSVHAAAL